MKITQDIRDHAAANGYGTNEALEKGMDEKSQQFTSMGSEIYIKA